MTVKKTKEEIADQREEDKKNNARTFYDLQIFNGNVHHKDKYNWSEVQEPWEKTAINYQYYSDNDLCCKIDKGNVRFYYADHYKLTLKTVTSDFPLLDSPSFYKNNKITSEIPIIPSGVIVDILEITTHHRTLTVKGKKNKYRFIMLKVHVSRSNTNISTDADVQPGYIGYIWRTFMVPINVVGPINICWTYKADASIKLSIYEIDRITRDYNNYSIPFPNDVKINFYADTTNRCKNNSLNKVKKTYPTLFESLHIAALNSNVKKINIGDLDYGGTGSHSQGRACDIVDIVTADTKPHRYYRKYTLNKETEEMEWTQPVQPPAILAFENAFLDHTIDPNTNKPRNPYSELIWGPWYMHDVDGSKVPNLICDNPEMGTLNIPDKDDYIKEMLSKEPPEVRNDKKLLNEKIKKIEKQYILEFGRNPIVGGLVKNSHDKFGNEISVTNDDIWGKKVIDHFQHRHHGHYQVKKK